ncbi:MAG: hypothetical protein FWG79_05065 [Bacteroidales bacterium]|nr:hypothetical protein [Bacteroidales bacterium]
MQKFVIIVGLLTLLVACKPKPDGEVVARVMDEYLYLSELEGIVPPGTLQTDSLEAIQAYIHNWIQQKLLIQKAKRNLPEHQKIFEQEIENYRNSLIIFAYQNALIEQAVDTVISESDLENYYEENKQMFLLRNNVVRVRFVKLENLPKNSRDRDIQARIKENQTIAELIFSQNLTGEDWLKLSELSQKNSTNFYLDSDHWIYFNDLLKEIPIDAYPQEDFLRRHSKFEVPDDDYIYYVNIVEFSLRGDYSPIEFEHEKIRNIILNNRKVQLIENLRNEVMVEGQERNWFEIY